MSEDADYPKRVGSLPENGDGQMSETSFKLQITTVNNDTKCDNSINHATDNIQNNSGLRT
jgi:hypothetical protein